MCCKNGIDQFKIYYDNSADVFKPIQDKDLHLIQINVVFRHGARTPLFVNTTLGPMVYDESLGDNLPETMFHYNVVREKDGRPAGAPVLERSIRNVQLPGGCHASILTTVGQRQMYRLGQLLKRHYLEALKLRRYSSTEVAIRSTLIDRTIDSLRCVLAGLFGNKHLGTKDNPVQIPVKMNEDEDLYPNKSYCPLLAQAVSMAVGSMQRQSWYTTDVKVLLSAIKGARQDQVDFSRLYDDIAARLEHGGEYPRFLLPHRRMIENNAARSIHYVYCENPYRDLTRMCTGRSMNTLLKEMTKSVNMTSDIKIRLLSGHDTTLVPLMEVFGVWQNRWPEFGANFVWELYRSTRDSSCYVRVLFRGLPIRIPGQEDELIPFEDFREFLVPYTMNEADFEQSCYDVLNS